MYNDAWDDYYDHREDAREDWIDHREDLSEERTDRRENTQEQRTDRQEETGRRTDRRRRRSRGLRRSRRLRSARDKALRRRPHRHNAPPIAPAAQRREATAREAGRRSPRPRAPAAAALARTHSRVTRAARRSAHRALEVRRAAAAPRRLAWRWRSSSMTRIREVIGMNTYLRRRIAAVALLSACRVHGRPCSRRPRPRRRSRHLRRP